MDLHPKEVVEVGEVVEVIEMAWVAAQYVVLVVIRHGIVDPREMVRRAIPFGPTHQVCFRAPPLEVGVSPIGNDVGG